MVISNNDIVRRGSMLVENSHDGIGAQTSKKKT